MIHQDSKRRLPPPQIRTSGFQQGSFQSQNPRPSDSKTSYIQTQIPRPQIPEPIQAPCSISNLRLDPQTQAQPQTLTQRCYSSPASPAATCTARGGRSVGAGPSALEPWKPPAGGRRPKALLMSGARPVVPVSSPPQFPSASNTRLRTCKMA